VIHLPQDGARAAADRAFREIRHKFRDWLTYLRRMHDIKLKPYYVFAFENPDGLTHVNWVLHVPDALKSAFEAKLQKWVAKVMETVRPFDIDVQPVTRNAKRLAKYVVKGTDPAFVPHFHLGDVHKPQGWFCGQRARVSASLDKTARATAGFRPRRRQRFWESAAAAHAP
jgi:hypothetical protein